MPEVKWIKIVTEFFDDEKIKLIEAMPESDMILIIWIKILTLAGKKNMSGYIFLTENIPYTDEMLSTLFNRPLNTVRLALDIFKKFKMINYDGNNVIKITNWEKHQNVEGLDKIREQNRLRQQKHREKLKGLPEPKEDSHVTNHVSHKTDKIRVDKNRLELDKINNIYDHWNNKEIKVHKKIDNFKSAIKIALTKYTEEDIITAIDNYSYILNNGNYFYTHKFTLTKFLIVTAKTNHIEDFLNLEDAKNNYKDFKKGASNAKDNQLPGEDKYKGVEEVHEV